MVEDRQFHDQSQGPFAVPLVELVSGLEVNIRVLLGDLQLQRGLRGRVFGQGTEDVRAVQEWEQENRKEAIPVKADSIKEKP